MEALKASELRIGNWVEVINSNGVETTIQASSFSVDIETHYKAIPLTTKWLNMFGFVYSHKIGMRSFYNIGNLYVEILSNDKFAVYYHSDNAICYWSYIHQLQNLFFALSGEELTIK